MDSTTTSALHIGPHIHSVGGTQSVIRVIQSHSIGADRVRATATWDGPNYERNTKLMVAAAAAIARLGHETLVHFHISNGGAWLREGLLIRLAVARGLRTIVTLHGYEFPDFARSHPRAVRMVLSGADHVICLSDEARYEVQRIATMQKVTVLANPVAIDTEAPSADQTPPVALFAGAIGLRKGVDILVKAWEKLLAGNVAGACRIVGPIEDFTPPHLERLSVEAAVHPDAIPDLVRQARVVVLPSRAEGMPMILTEALAAGRPFVATPVGGTSTITPDPAMLVPVGDVDALAEAIGRYLGDRHLARDAGERGQRYIRETRSPEVIDQELRQIYAVVR